MKKILFSSLLAMLILVSGSNLKANAPSVISIQTNEWTAFYKYLGSNISYPSKAKQADVQGKNLILFTISKGKIKDLKVQNALDSDCDTEVLNKLLSFGNYASIKDGKYALKTLFKINGSNAELKNNEVLAPAGYTELKLITISVFNQSKATIGFSGVSKNFPSETLIVLNGKIIDYSTLDEINSNDVESLDVLKNTTAISLYGDKGKNGAILITTKKNANLLKGKVTGLSIQKADNENASIRIRGEKSWGNESPLYVLDGKINDIQNLSPDDIESITVLKDAASTLPYGEKGKNGVLVITTKKRASISSQKNEDSGKSNIIIRGEKSWGKETPLYVLDGEISKELDLNSISPDSIASVTILKDEASIALYGEGAKNGVIIITTKKTVDSKESTQKAKQKP